METAAANANDIVLRTYQSGKNLRKSEKNWRDRFTARLVILPMLPKMDMMGRT